MFGEHDLLRNEKITAWESRATFAGANSDMDAPILSGEALVREEARTGMLKSWGCEVLGFFRVLLR